MRQALYRSDYYNIDVVDSIVEFTISPTATFGYDAIQNHKHVSAFICKQLNRPYKRLTIIKASGNLTTEVQQFLKEFTENDEYIAHAIIVPNLIKKLALQIFLRSVPCYQEATEIFTSYRNGLTWLNKQSHDTDSHDITPLELEELSKAF